MKKIILAALMAAFAIPTTAHAQWADPGDSRAGVVTYSAASPQPVEVGAVTDGAESHASEQTSDPSLASEGSGLVEAVGGAVGRADPCNPYRGCGTGLPPSIEVTTPARPDVCNPLELCGVTLPPGVSIVTPDRPAIPCTQWTLRHCAPGEVPHSI